MRKILIFVLALLIVLSSVAVVSAVNDSEAKLEKLVLPNTWVDKNISEVNGSSRLVAFSPDHSLEFDIDFDTDLDTNKLMGIGRGYLYQYEGGLVEIVKIDGEKYRVGVKCNGTDNISSQRDKVDDAEHQIFKFQDLNNCWAINLNQ